MQYNLGRTEWLSLVGILSGLPMLLTLPALEKKFSKRNLMFFSVAGLIAAFQGFFVKGGMGLTCFIIGVFLKNGGYVANAVQTEKALFYIEICFIWIPIVLCVIIAVLTYFYKLDSLRTTMTEELDNRRESMNIKCEALAE